MSHGRHASLLAAGPCLCVLPLVTNLVSTTTTKETYYHKRYLIIQAIYTATLLATVWVCLPW